MARFELGACAEVIATGRVGVVEERNRTKVTLCFFDKEYIEPEYITFKDHELKPTGTPTITTSQLGPFVRGEITLEAVSNGINYLSDYVKTDSKAYKISVADILVGVNVYEKMSPKDVLKWIDTIMQFEEELSFTDDPWKDIVDEVKEKDILNLAYNGLEEIRWDTFEDEPVELLNEDFKRLKDCLETWIKSEGKEYPESLVRRIANQFDSDSIDKQSEKTQQLFKKCLDSLCDKKDPKAIQRRGYCYYCGTKIYPNDWIKARDAFIEYYQLTGDASAANTLGYIYYYGRCNGGVPEYEEAFKYFSIGHAYTYFESTYKLADMFAHGYGVVKDGETANHLYWSVYKQNIKRLIKEDYECKFADAALRMGNCFRDEIGAQKDLETAYYYYLQADFAIRKRTAVANHYGDTVVFNGIQKALEDVRKEYTTKGRTEKFIYPGWTKWTLIKHRGCKLKIKELKDGVLSLTASPMKRFDEEKAPLMLITIPKADYCELRDRITIKTAKNSTYGIFDGASEIIFDHVEFDYGKRITKFYQYDKCIGEICTEEYFFTAPTVKKKLSGEVYHFVSVCFEESGRCYDYICDNKSVKVGDKVIVDGYDGKKTVKVVAAFEKYESQLGLPIERFKKIIKKI
ncbi:MAG: sel1 repeat family protein [Lachnospiraceae bacterium]|nr:sel1 repeat family protein [Lachnospiraceae bacterium]